MKIFKQMDKEIINFILHALFNPIRIPNYLYSLMLKVCGKIGFRKGFSSYPDYIKRIIRGKNRLLNKHSAISAASSYNHGYPAEKEKIKLLYREINFEVGVRNAFDYFDEEEALFFHRFNWLLIKLSESSSVSYEWGSEKIKYWFLSNRNNKHQFFWEAYSASERVCNSLIFFILTSGRNSLTPPEWLCDFIDDSARHIINNLEFMFRGKTNNHILNNARGLYFAGVCLNNQRYKDISYAILQNEMSKIITKDGLTDEGSAHYHFLITRWLLEALWLAEIVGDYQAKSIIFDTVKKAVEQCWFFLVFCQGRYSFPLIGDVSPDFPPGWLINLPWSKIALSIYKPEYLPARPREKGWADLFGVLDGDSKLVPKEGFSQVGGFFKLVSGRFILYWHIAGKKLNHSHCDLGSFCLYIDGYPVVIDVGRFSYAQDYSGVYGLSAQAHNSLVIDGLEPFAIRWFPDFYKALEVKTECQSDNVLFSFKISHNGFSRHCRERIGYERFFQIRDNKLSISDNFSGKMTHKITQFFHFDPQVIIKKEGLRGFILEARGLKFVFKEDSLSSEKVAATIEEDSFFPQYAQKVPSKMIKISQAQKFPYTQKFTIELL